MKSLVIFCSLLTVSLCQYCYKDMKRECQQLDIEKTQNCTAKYGGAHDLVYMNKLTTYADVHITRSFEYLLMAAHFRNYEKSREGFRQLFRKLSDTAWNDAIDLIKYIAMRGGSLNFKYDDDTPLRNDISKFSEVASVAKALDIQKRLAKEAHNLHKLIHKHDPEMSSYLEEKFMHDQAKTIRDLAGYTNDLVGLLHAKQKNVGLPLFLFDHFLQQAS